ncbi:MAG: GNAT family N-acetyltransferase [Spirochaetota bacterium]
MFIEVKDKNQIDILERLAKEIWTEHYSPIIGKVQVDYMLDKYQSAKAIKNQISNEKFIYYLIYDKNYPSGYIGIQFKEDELFLSKLYVLNLKRNKGFGRKAIQFIVGLAKEKHLNKISLTVNKYNTGTIKAYEKFGFDNLGSVVADIGNGFIMDDYKMVKSF